MSLRNVFNKSYFEDPIFILRIWLGFAFIMHGYHVFDADYMMGTVAFMESYGIPYADTMAYLSKGTEFFCGLLLLFGLFTKFASFALVINMLVATFYAMRGDIFGDYQAELSLVYLLIALTIFLSKPSIFSLDNLIFKEKKKLEIA